jgi:hypothetical protein
VLQIDVIAISRQKMLQAKTPPNERIYDNETMRWRPRKRIYTVWLIYVATTDWLMYFCPDCRNPIAQYQGQLVMEHPGYKPFNLDHAPVMIQCKNPQCGRKIVFQDALHRDE